MTASSGTWQDDVRPSVLKLQFIVATMAVGCIVFLFIALFFIGGQGPLNWQAAGMGTWIAIGIAACALTVRLAVVRYLTYRARRAIVHGELDESKWKVQFVGGEEPPASAGDAQRFFAVLQVRSIIGAAICEGCAFFALVAYVAEHNVLSLVVAVLSILCLATHLPTRSGTVRWIEDQLASVAQERGLNE